MANKTKVIINVNKDTKTVDLSKYSKVPLKSARIHKKDILCGFHGRHSTPVFWDYKWKTVEDWYNYNVEQMKIQNEDLLYTYSKDAIAVYRLNSTINRVRNNAPEEIKPVEQIKPIEQNSDMVKVYSMKNNFAADLDNYVEVFSGPMLPSDIKCNCLGEFSDHTYCGDWAIERWIKEANGQIFRQKNMQNIKEVYTDWKNNTPTIENVNFDLYEEIASGPLLLSDIGAAWTNTYYYKWDYIIKQNPSDLVISKMNTVELWKEYFGLENKVYRLKNNTTATVSYIKDAGDAIFYDAITSTDELLLNKIVTIVFL